jgi:hypothetical protein
MDICEIKDKEIRDSINELSTGCFIMAFKDTKKNKMIEGVTVHKYLSSFSLMIPKPDLAGLKIKFGL